MKTIKDYYNNDFRADIKRIDFNDGSPTMQGYFKQESWLKAVESITDKTERVYFAFSMLITIATDQTMFTYFKGNYKQFETLTRYPKFGWHGLGPHNQNPFLLLLNPLEAGFLAETDITPVVDEFCTLFVDEINDFTKNHMTNISTKELLGAFIGDKNMVVTAEQHKLVGEIVETLKEKY